LKGERLLLKYDGDPLQVLISSPKRGHMISRLDGFLSVGSTGGRDYDQDQLYQGEDMDRVPTETARVEIMQRAIDVFPDLENALLVEQLAGSRPLSPDRMPIIGPVPGKEGVVLATGHTTKGIHLGPSTAKAVTEYIQGGCKQVPASIELFLPDRFAGMTDADFQTAGLNVDE
jgi:glycine/D-amino acid oxidase-like deaminating enzyme